MWVLARRHTSAADNIAFALEIEGELDPASCGPRVSDVLERHEALRTVFRRSTDVRSRWSSPQHRYPRSSRRRNVCADRCRSWQPVRSTSPRRAGAPGPVPHGEHVPHSGRRAPRGAGRAVGGAAVPRSDGGVRGRRRGTEPGWSPVRMRYTDYARWQRELSAIRRSGSRAHEDLSTGPSVSRRRRRSSNCRPIDREARVRFCRRRNGDLHDPAELHAALEKVAVGVRRPPPSWWCTQRSWCCSPARLSGSDDVSVGTPVSGRSGPGLHDLVGMLVGTVVLRATVDQTRSFVDLLGRIRRDDSTRSLMRGDAVRPGRRTRGTANLGCTPPSVQGDARVRELRARRGPGAWDSTFVSMKSTADKHVSISRSPFASETSVSMGRRPGSTVC
ncbi:hypothetical protein GS582_11570 [Rhodococcus hoagii]|nr:hypothetical protein [Prescottella equi]